jgi:Ca2+/Na+ antiporter
LRLPSPERAFICYIRREEPASALGAAISSPPTKSTAIVAIAAIMMMIVIVIVIAIIIIIIITIIIIIIIIAIRMRGLLIQVNILPRWARAATRHLGCLAPSADLVLS